MVSPKLLGLFFTNSPEFNKRCWAPSVSTRGEALHTRPFLLETRPSVPRRPVMDNTRNIRFVPEGWSGGGEREQSFKTHWIYINIHILSSILLQQSSQSWVNCNYWNNTVFACQFLINKNIYVLTNDLWEVVVRMVNSSSNIKSYKNTKKPGLMKKSKTKLPFQYHINF